jgi:hypothetical protein
MIGKKLYRFDIASFSFGLLTALMILIIAGILWLAFGGNP